MAVRESRIYPAWRQTRHLPRLAASPVFIPLGGEPSVCPAWRRPRFYLAWRRAQVLPRLATNPGFTPLGGAPGFIPLGGEPSVCPAWRRPRFYPAWRRAQVLPRLAASPGFTPLGDDPGFTSLGGKPSVYPAWRAPGKKNGGLPRRPASANIRAAAPFITLRCATAATFVPLLWDRGGRGCCLTIAFFCRLSFSTHRQLGFRSICCRALAFTTSGLRGFRLIPLLLDRGRFGKCRTTSQQTGKRQ